MRALLDAVDFGLILVDRHGVVRLANHWIRERVRVESELQDRPLEQALGQAPDAKLVAAVRDCLARGNAVRLSQAFHATPLPLYAPAGGEPGRVRQAVDVRPVMWPEGGERHALIQVRDVSQVVRREQTLQDQARQLAHELERATQAQQEIERQSLRLREITRLAPVALFETDAEGRVVFANPRAFELLGATTGTLVGRDWVTLFGESGRSIVQAWRERLRMAAEGERFADEISITRGDATRWLRVEAIGRPDTGDGPGGHLVTLLDVTEFHEVASRHAFRASHDALTGLYNREHFDESLRASLRTGPLGLMFLDLDLFKQINDTHGHAAGDLVLKTVADRLSGVARRDDLVARLGGDEFAIVLPRLVDRGVLHRLARELGDAVAEPIDIGGPVVRVGVAIGSVLAPDDATDADRLLAAADAAMYGAKRRRRDAPGRSGWVPEATVGPRLEQAGYL